MQITKSQNSINFNGNFQGVIKIGDRVRNFPVKKVHACPYADKFMMKLIRKVLKKQREPNILGFSLEETGGVKNILFQLDKQSVKKNIPILTRLTRGAFSDLSNPIFWKMLKNKATHSIKYSFSQEDCKKMVEYFESPMSNASKLEGGVFAAECPTISKKVQKFKSALLCITTKEADKAWLTDFFNK